MEGKRVSPEEIKQALDRGRRVTFVDARSESAWAGSDVEIPESVRVPPDDAREAIDRVPRNLPVVTYCT